MYLTPERHPGPGFVGCDDPLDHVDADVRHQRSTAARLLHKGHRRLDGGESAVFYVLLLLLLLLLTYDVGGVPFHKNIGAGARALW